MNVKISVFTLFILFSVVIAYQIYCCEVIEGMEEEDEKNNNIQLEIPTIGTVPDALKIPEEDKDVGEKEKCQPCPPCGRCPEPAFECKKVPTYSHISHMQNVPEALGDYTTYGV